MYFIKLNKRRLACQLLLYKFNIAQLVKTSKENVSISNSAKPIPLALFIKCGIQYHNQHDI